METHTEKSGIRSSGEKDQEVVRGETMERRRSKLMDCSLAGSRRTSSESTIGEAEK